MELLCNQPTKRESKSVRQISQQTALFMPNGLLYQEKILYTSHNTLLLIFCTQVIVRMMELRMFCNQPKESHSVCREKSRQTALFMPNGLRVPREDTVYFPLCIAFDIQVIMRMLVTKYQQEKSLKKDNRNGVNQQGDSFTQHEY